MRIHIAILKRPYLNMILDGRKQLECRLTRTKCPPFKQISAGEKVLLKESGGPIRGEAIVKSVQFFDDLSPSDVETLHQEYNDQILGAIEYWQSRKNCRCCSLIWLKKVKKIPPYRVKTKGMRAWLTFENSLPSSLSVDIL